MSLTNQSKIVPKNVLVTGASGLLGVAAIEKFLSAGWEVVGVSRRKPELPSGRNVEFLAVDLRDQQAARAAFEPLTDVTHIAYTALHAEIDTLEAFSAGLQSFIDRKLLPPARH
jgi:nucleoside-diphosphate-sugar epimerase